MKKIYLSFLLSGVIMLMQAQTLVSSTYMGSFTKSELDSILTANGIPYSFLGTTYGVKVYKLDYNTVSYDSSTTTASGLMAVPVDTSGCRLPIVSYQHSPMSIKTDAPSNMNDQEAFITLVLASNGYVGIAPDYLGLGDSPDFPAFLHAHSEATAIVDMIRATREMADTLGVPLNSEIFLAGYSQGGHATMAAHKLIQAQLGNEMQVTASFPMSGPYDMGHIMKNEFLTNPNYPEPSMVAYTFITWNKIYHFYDSLSAVLVPPYDSVLPPLFDGTHDFYTADNYISGPAYSIFNPDTLAAILADSNHPVRRAFLDNDVYNWLPATPTKMLYCQGDHYVPYQNAITAYTYMQGGGSQLCDTFDVNPGLNHGGCSELAILAGKEFVDDVATIDCPSGISSDAFSLFSIRPNPATSYLQLMNEPAGLRAIKVYAADGQMMLEQKSFKTIIDVSHLSPGLYIVHLTTQSGQVVQRKFIKQ